MKNRLAAFYFLKDKQYITVDNSVVLLYCLQQEGTYEDYNQ